MPWVYKFDGLYTQGISEEKRAHTMVSPRAGRLVDYGGPQVIFIDHKLRALWVRAGHVDGGGVVHLRFQRQYINSEIIDAIRMTAEQWQALVAAVGTRIATPSVERRIHRRATRAFAVHRLRGRTGTRVS